MAWRPALTSILLLAALVLPAAPFAACEVPDAVLARARALQSPAGRVALLEQIIPACRDFALANALGEGYALSGNLAGAKAAFLEALDNAKNQEQRAETFYNLGVVTHQQGKSGEAIRYFRESLKRKANPELEQHLLALERSSGSAMVTADTIAAELNPATITTKNIGRSKGFSVCPSIDIRVEFDFNAASLKAEGKRQADEIARAMQSESFKEFTFRIVGHTDLVGGDQANDRLSLKRAEALKEYLVKNGSVAASRLAVEGKGKRMPLFRDQKEQARNRRVEIQLVSAAGGDTCTH